MPNEDCTSCGYPVRTHRSDESKLLYTCPRCHNVLSEPIQVGSTIEGGQTPKEVKPLLD